VIVFRTRDWVICQRSGECCQFAAFTVMVMFAGFACRVRLPGSPACFSLGVKRRGGEITKLPPA